MPVFILLAILSVMVMDSRAFTIRKGTPSDDISNPDYPYYNLKQVIHKMKAIPAMTRLFDGPDATVINVGAAYKDLDPLYELPLTNLFPNGFRLIGYECDHERADILRNVLSYVTVRELCLTGRNIVPDLQSLNVSKELAILKTDIDSVDGPVLDSILSHYKPAIVYSEFIWDWIPPIDFSLIHFDPEYALKAKRGCWGMSLNLAYRLLQSHGYSIICASYYNLMAVHNSVFEMTSSTSELNTEEHGHGSGSVFDIMPHDPFYWYQFVKSPATHTHWHDEGGSPFVHVMHGLYSELHGNGPDGFHLPATQYRSLDKIMAKVARVVSTSCRGNKYMLAVGDRCCAPQWFKGVNGAENCLCDLQHDEELP